MNNKGFSVAELILATAAFAVSFAAVFFYSATPTQTFTAKYGPAESPFYRKILNLFRIKGRVISGANNSPVGDLKITLVNKGIETTTNKNGYFLFEIFDTTETEFKIEVPTGSRNGESQMHTVKFKELGKNIYTPKIQSREATIEIKL